MQIEKNKVALFHYCLSNDKDELLEESLDGDPTAYLHGGGTILPALEQALAGKRAGDKLNLTLAPAEAYGHYRDDARARVPIKHLLTKGRLKPGMVVDINTAEGVRVATVTKVGLKNVDVDSNHPLAGMTLRFDIEIVEVRDASAEEIEHGHVHGVGGHDH